MPLWMVTYFQKTLKSSSFSVLPSPKLHERSGVSTNWIETDVQAFHLLLLSLSSMRRELSSLEYSVSHSTQAAPYTHARQNRLLFANRQRGIFRLRLGCANTQWPPVFLVPFCKNLARMNGTPKPNQKGLLALGIEPGSLDHEPQPLIIGPLCWILFVSKSHKIWHQLLSVRSILTLSRAQAKSWWEKLKKW